MVRVETISITKQQSYVLTLEAIILLLVGAALFTGSTGANELGAVGLMGVVVYIATLVVHELLHGLGFLLAGARPHFGVGFAGVIPIAYATANSKLKLPSILFAAYLPFVALSITFIYVAKAFPEYQALAMIGFVGNFAGAVGDLWLAGRLWKYLPFRDVHVRDVKSGIEVFSDSKDALRRGRQAAQRSQTESSKFGKQWAISSLAIMLVQFFTPMLVTLLGVSGNFTLGVGWFYLFQIQSVQSGKTSSATINILTPIVLGFVLALAMKLKSGKNSK